MNRTLARNTPLLALLLIPAALVGCRSLLQPLVDLRGYRYCEILLDYDDATEVWGTPGLNRCSADAWEALDPATIQAAHGATGIAMNGPRYFLANRGSGAELPKVATRMYGDVEMKLLASVVTDEPESYAPVTVLRTNVWTFKRGQEIYELTDPEGRVYVMQSYSQIVIPDLNESELSALGERLALPPGWTFSSRVLEEPLELVADGEVTVVQDDLTNTYQRR